MNSCCSHDFQASVSHYSSVVVVKNSDLPLHCPMEGAPLWSLHPRVFLPIEDSPNQTLTCPYCSTIYKVGSST